MKLLVDTPTTFVQIVEWLFANNDKIKGAQILFPDTVFFDEGKPSFIARVDKDGCLFKITQSSKIALQEIRQKFSQIVRDRRKEAGLFMFNQGIISSLTQKQSSNQDPSSPSSSPNQGNTQTQQQLETKQTMQEEKSIYYKEVAIIRYNKRSQMLSFREAPKEA